MEDEPYEGCIVCERPRPESECQTSCMGCGEPICDHCEGSDKAENHEARCETKHNRRILKMHQKELWSANN